jgi:hypothetical protein
MARYLMAARATSAITGKLPTNGIEKKMAEKQQYGEDEDICDGYLHVQAVCTTPQGNAVRTIAVHLSDDVADDS